MISKTRESNVGTTKKTTKMKSGRNAVSTPPTPKQALKGILKKPALTAHSVSGKSSYDHAVTKKKNHLAKKSKHETAFTQVDDSVFPDNQDMETSTKNRPIKGKNSERKKKREFLPTNCAFYFDASTCPSVFSVISW
uniref:PUM-HD domain-containing protein n=1 Tax=Mesocestoides corti TaxID=53468 RepID=A0A5K3F1M5_MESCO